MTKKLQKKVVKKAEPKKAEPSKKADTGKKAEATTKAAKVPIKKPAATASADGNGLGKKHTCYSCATKFYDFGREEKICPKCGADQSTRPAVKVRVPKSSPKLSEFDVVDEDVVAELGTEDDILLEPDAEMDDPEPIIDEEEA
ncbi:MAG TPA: FYDLN acid domain-containing protein [Leptospiraceae bacterium]|nr:FYDLN acid domain-containing protein [Leptospiraceae bacterium]HMW07473.1 FYDLN acid domain-containing protein [Leptospiraceae bacterium]HMX34910.1 FYDLN acid domain-containing protein [Leptospiraceae bacterium]HMY33133.1 FYDLN acid domain-containing protein [Leptospiraceae bacterium]HMZ67359.1 FYDLN acid domain-containing protein [Leptospiraceae bacterium]